MEQIDKTLVEGASKGAWVPLAALITWCLVAILKSNLVPIAIPPRARPIIALVLGQVYAVLAAVHGGVSWPAAVLSGLAVTVGAVGGQELGGALRPFLVGLIRRGAKMPGSMLLVVLLAGACSGALGCSASLADAVRVADGAHITGEAMRPVIEEHCIKAVATAPDVAALREVCDPVLIAWDALRTGHAALRAGILAVHAGAAGLASLLGPMAEVGAAAASLAESVRALEVGR